MEKIKQIFFTMDVAGKRRLGVPIMIGSKTGWFKIMHGAKTSFTIKRDFQKHNIKLVEGKRI